MYYLFFIPYLYSYYYSLLFFFIYYFFILFIVSYYLLLIIYIVFVGACTNPFCLVTKYYKNKSLEHVFKKRPALKAQITQKILTKMMRDAAAGICHLHCEGVIHRVSALPHSLPHSHSHAHSHSHS